MTHHSAISYKIKVCDVYKRQSSREHFLRDIITIAKWKNEGEDVLNTLNIITQQ